MPVPRPTARLVPGLAAIVAAVALTVSALPAAAAERTVPAADPGATPTVSVPVSVTASPSPDDVRRQREQVAQLDGTAAAQADEVAAAREELRKLADQAGASLEAYESARAAALTRKEDATRQQARLVAATRDAADARVEVGTFASAAYRDTGGTGDLGPMIAMLDARNPSEFWRGVRVLQSVGDQRAAAFARLRLAEHSQVQATKASLAAARAAASAETSMRSAKTAADDLVKDQEEAVAQLQTRLAETLGQAAEASRKADAMDRALAVAVQRGLSADRARALALASGEVVLGAGECQGGDVDAFPNGMIPAEVLCPLWGTKHHLLRAQAAAAFGRMSKVYAEEFGRPICVTDSYRSYEMQVDLARRKPGLAATPGTSNHGWARAVDLCDGVNVFGTPTHEWLKANAPVFGWYHPQWAQAGGSRPEPWHWEFAG